MEVAPGASEVPKFRQFGQVVGCRGVRRKAGESIPDARGASGRARSASDAAPLPNAVLGTRILALACEALPRQPPRPRGSQLYWASLQPWGSRRQFSKAGTDSMDMAPISTALFSRAGNVAKETHWSPASAKADPALARLYEKRARTQSTLAPSKRSASAHLMLEPPVLIKSSTKTTLCPSADGPSTWRPIPCAFGSGLTYAIGRPKRSAASAAHGMPAVLAPARRVGASGPAPTEWAKASAI
jgi:hypothetical protein